VKGNPPRRRGRAARGDGRGRVVVSNHGGRQLDGAVAALDALPPVVRAVKGRISVLVDGGVRRGVDVVKALALGAEGVMLGRATLYGACLRARRAPRAPWRSCATSWCAPCSSRACARGRDRGGLDRELNELDIAAAPFQYSALAGKCRLPAR